MPDDGMNIGYGRGDGSASPVHPHDGGSAGSYGSTSPVRPHNGGPAGSYGSTSPAHRSNPVTPLPINDDDDIFALYVHHHNAPSPVAHNNMQRRVPAERGNVGDATVSGEGGRSDDWLSSASLPTPNGSPTHARRPFRTVPLVPLEGVNGITTRKESAQAVWNYIGDTDEIMPVAPAAPASSASEPGEAINDDDFTQPQTLSLPAMPRLSQGRTPRRASRNPYSYSYTGEHEVRQIPVRRRRLVRTESTAPTEQAQTGIYPSVTRQTGRLPDTTEQTQMATRRSGATPVTEHLQMATRQSGTAPLSSPYDRLHPSWQLRSKRDTIFLALLTLLVLSILGIMSCNYLLSLYHV